VGATTTTEEEATVMAAALAKAEEGRRLAEARIIEAEGFVLGLLLLAETEEEHGTTIELFVAAPAATAPREASTASPREAAEDAEETAAALALTTTIEAAEEQTEEGLLEGLAPDWPNPLLLASCATCSASG